MSTPPAPEVTPETTPPAPEVTPPAPDPDALGDAGKAALTAERNARKAAETEAKTHATKAAELEAEVKRLQRANAAVKPGDLDAVKAEIRAEALLDVVEAKLEAAAVGKLKNAADAAVFIPRAKFAEFTKDGKADATAITKAIADLLTERPYLAADSAPANGAWGDVGGGNRETPSAEPVSAVDRMARAYANGKQ
ncbi:hypothetical protein [Streptomyces avermitilis]|uniref:hypothetical protein n=1 Tax=Streptomyces avermitilis TaxID=33903 RepID=UPI0038128D8C